MIQLENVSKSYKNGVHALRNINLTIEDGEFVYIIGPTGSGKSTLIKLLDGEEIPDEGDVIVNDVNVGKLKHSKVPYYRRNIGVVFQDFRLLPALTIFENISFALEVIGMDKRDIRRRVRKCWSWYRSATKRGRFRTSSPAGSSSVRRSAVRSPITRRCSSRMSRPETWIRRCPRRSWNCWRRSIRSSRRRWSW